MKKLLAVLLSAAIVTSISAPVLALGTKQEATYYENTKRCVVRGYLAESEKQFKEVSISLVDGEGNLVYADSTNIDNWGFYEFNFEYAGDLSDLTMNLRRDGEVITDYSDIKALAYSGAVSPEFKIMSAENGGKAYTAEVVLENKYGLNDKYSVIFAFYDENNGLVGTKNFENNSFDPVTSTTYFSVNVPEGTENVKAFLWSDFASIMPLAKKVESADFVPFEPEERIALVGASLQAGVKAEVTTTTYLEYLLKTRYPSYNIQVDNRAISGDAPTTASVARLEYDMFALTNMFGTDQAFQQACQDHGYNYKNLTPKQALHMSLYATFGSDNALNTALSQKGFALDTLTTVQIEELVDLATNSTVSENARGETISLLAGSSPTHVVMSWGTNAIDYFNRLQEEAFTPAAKAIAEKAYENYKMYVAKVFERPSVKRVTIISLSPSRQHPDRSLGYGPGAMYTIGYYNELTKQFVEDANKTRTYTANGVTHTLPEGAVLQFCDVWETVYELYKKNPTVSLNMFDDTTHANSKSHMFYTAKAFNELGFSPYVASVEADAQGQNINTINADITEFKNDSGVISYTYAPKAFPVAANSFYTDTIEKVYDISKYVNFETIKLTGLESTSYVLSLDGTEAGTYTKEELAKGINIAELSENPNQEISKEIFDNYLAVSKDYINTRRIYANIGGMNGNNGSLQDGIKLLKGVATNPFDYYQVAEDIYNRREAVKQYDKPVSYEVTLTPVID